MLFDVPFFADWSKVEEYRQKQMDNKTDRENSACVDWDYQSGNKILLSKDGILRKTERQYESDP